MRGLKRLAALVLTLCLLAAMLPMAVSAATISSGTCGTGVNWVLDSTGTLTISGSGAIKDISIIDTPPWYNYRANIRKVVIEDGITAIGKRAFSICSSLTSVTIPDGVWSIGENAFLSCSALTEITVPDSVLSIDQGAFQNCSSLKTVTLSNNILTISAYTFSGCKALTTVNVPQGVTSIGNSAFQNCSSLTQIAIPDSVTAIGTYAFSGSGLTSVTLPDGIAQIKEYTFYDCKGLTSITIPASVTTVDNSAFLVCNKLAAVFCLGTQDVKNSMTIEYSNNDFKDAAWHFEVTDAQLGTKQAKHCGNCDLYYLLDGTGADFADVSKTSWQIKSVNYAYVRGLMAGKGTDNVSGLVRFDPNSPISREEFVQVLYNAEGKPSVSLVNEFLDVQNTWYTKAVLWAKSKDIANGTPDGNFGVGKNITRQDLAMMLYKYAKMKGCDLSLNAGAINRFADGNKVSGYAKNAMDWAVTQGVLSGKGTTGSTVFYLDPAGTATRAECAAMLKNFMTNFGV